MSIYDEWENFLLVDMPPEAPPEQVHEMRRAFMAGIASGLKLGTTQGRTGATRTLAELGEFAQKKWL